MLLFHLPGPFRWREDKYSHVSSHVNFHLSSESLTDYCNISPLRPPLWGRGMSNVWLAPFESYRNWVRKRSPRTVQGHMPSACCRTGKRCVNSARSSLAWTPAQASSSVLVAQIGPLGSCPAPSKFKGLRTSMIILIYINIHLVYSTVTSRDEMSQGGITCLKVVVWGLIELISVCKTFSNPRIKGSNTKTQGLPLITEDKSKLIALCF